MFYITASSAFYVDASWSDNMELLKGPRRSAEAHVPRPPAATAAAPLGWQMAPAHIITSLRAFYSDTGGKCDSGGSRNSAFHLWMKTGRASENQTLTHLVIKKFIYFSNLSQNVKFIGKWKSIIQFFITLERVISIFYGKSRNTNYYYLRSCMVVIIMFKQLFCEYMYCIIF